MDIIAKDLGSWRLLLLSCFIALTFFGTLHSFGFEEIYGVVCILVICYHVIMRTGMIVLCDAIMHQEIFSTLCFQLESALC